jgi:hypothetical protein
VWGIDSDEPSFSLPDVNANAGRTEHSGPFRVMSEKKMRAAVRRRGESRSLGWNEKTRQRRHFMLLTVNGALVVLGVLGVVFGMLACQTILSLFHARSSH